MTTDSLSEQTLVRTALEGLFSGDQRAAAHSLAAQARFETVGEGQVLMAEGAAADDLFVLCAGRLHVYGRDGSGALGLVASIEQAGQVVGEQAFIDDRKFRNATLIALQSGRVARIPGDAFREHLARDQAALARLSAIGTQQFEHRLSALALELDDSLGAALSQSAPRACQFDAGESLFTAGEPALHAFLIVSGQIGLTNPHNGKTEARLGRGLTLGVDAVASGGEHPLNAVALEPSEVVALSDVAISALLEQTAADAPAGGGFALGQGIQTSSTHVALSSTSRDLGGACITTDFLAPAGGVVRVKHYPERGQTYALIKGADVAAAQVIATPQGDRLLTLDPETGDVWGLSAPSDWTDLPRAIDLLLQRQQLSAIEQEAFARHGRLLIGDRAGGEGALSGMVCSCRAVTAIQLQDLAAEGASVDDMVARTGAGTVCGGCKDLLPLFTQTAQETLCWIAPETLPGGVVRVRLNFGSNDGNAEKKAELARLSRAKAGDFIRVSAMVRGQWLQRPYTLTDWDDSSLEITVKLEDRGQFSDWLRAAAPGDLVKVGTPEGHAYGIEGETRPLVFIVAGIGVTPALAAVRKLVGTRALDVRYVFRDPAEATGLSQLQSLAQAGEISLATFATGASGGAGGGRPSVDALIEDIDAMGPAQVVVCGPEGFNAPLREALAPLSNIEVFVEDFQETIGRGVNPGAGNGKGTAHAIRSPDFIPERPRESLFTRKTPGTMAEEAEDFLREFYRSERPGEDPAERLGTVREAIGTQGSWRKTAEELAFAAQVAWRNAPRCIGRLYWKGLHLRDGRDLQTADEIALALFEHMRFAFNGGAIRPAITVFDPSGQDGQAPRIWNPQLQLYAGYRLRSGQQVGDPGQNALTEAIMALGWEPSGSRFEILPLVIQGIDGRPRIFELPDDVRHEVPLSHPGYPAFSAMKLRWHAVPYVSDLRLDAGGITYPFAPFNGWFMNTEIAARNLTDHNRYDLLEPVAEAMGLDRRNDRDLWRDKALIMLNEAVIGSFDEAGVRLADHHNATRDFVEFCRAEQRAGREVFGEWMWLVPPVSASLSPLYQQPFANISVKPAYAYQRAVWKPAPTV